MLSKILSPKNFESQRLLWLRGSTRLQHQSSLWILNNYCLRQQSNLIPLDKIGCMDFFCHWILFFINFILFILFIYAFYLCNFYFLFVFLNFPLILLSMNFNIDLVSKVEHWCRNIPKIYSGAIHKGQRLQCQYLHSILPIKVNTISRIFNCPNIPPTQLMPASTMLDDAM